MVVATRKVDSDAESSCGFGEVPKGTERDFAFKTQGITRIGRVYWSAGCDFKFLQVKKVFNGN